MESFEFIPHQKPLYLQLPPKHHVNTCDVLLCAHTSGKSIMFSNKTTKGLGSTMASKYIYVAVCVSVTEWLTPVFWKQPQETLSIWLLLHPAQNWRQTRKMSEGVVNKRKVGHRNVCRDTPQAVVFTNCIVHTCDIQRKQIGQRGKTIWERRIHLARNKALPQSRMPKKFWSRPCQIFGDVSKIDWRISLY